MSHETTSYSQDTIDSHMAERTLHDAELIRTGARYSLGQFVISDRQYKDTYAEMARELSSREGELTLQKASEMSAEKFEEVLRDNLSAVLALRANKKVFQYVYDEEKKSGEYVCVSDTTPSLIEDTGVSTDNQAESYIEFIPVGEQVRFDPLYRHAITMSLDASQVGVSEKVISMDIPQSSRYADEAIVDVRPSEGIQTNRYSGTYRRGGRYGSREATLEEKAYISNLLHRLAATDNTVKTKISTEVRTVSRREKPYKS